MNQQLTLNNSIRGILKAVILATSPWHEDNLVR